ncbi:MAG TPA: ABC transporter substrate-binding protein [Opitutaceae bacterium]|nr:ABC transporter substrate-binding protein [Opitutaceae bacterium]
MRLSRFSLVLIAFTFAARLTADEPLKPVLMQLDWVPNVQFAGIYMAKEKGFYREAGLDVTIRPVVKDQETVGTVLASPGFALGCAESNVLMLAHAKGANIKALATMFQDSPMGWMSLKKTGINTIDDFAGKKIGIHPDGDRVLDLLMAHSKAKRSDATVVPSGYDPTTVLNGEVDAQQGYVIDEFVRLQLQSGGNATMIMAKDYGYLSYSQVFFAPARLTAERPNLVRDFLAASKRGWEYALAHRDETVDVILKVAPTLDRAYQRASLDAVADLVSPHGQTPMASMSVNKWVASENEFIQYGILQKKTNVKDLLDFSFNPGNAPKWYNPAKRLSFWTRMWNHFPPAPNHRDYYFW